MKKPSKTKAAPEPAIEERYPGGLTWVDEEYDPRLGGKDPRAESSPATQRPARQFAIEAVAAVFPDGVPSAANLPNKKLVQKVRDYLKQHPADRPPPSDDTIKRAAGRK